MTAAMATARGRLRIVPSLILNRTDRRPRCAGSSGRVATQLLVNAASVDDAVHLQARDFVLHQQLATLQLDDLKIVDRRMRAGFGNFRFQGLVPSLELRKMRLYGHVGGFSSVRLLPDPGSVHRFAPFSKWVPLVRRSNPDLRDVSIGRLEDRRAKRDTFPQGFGVARFGVPISAWPEVSYALLPAGGCGPG